MDKADLARYESTKTSNVIVALIKTIKQKKTIRDQVKLNKVENEILQAMLYQMSLENKIEELSNYSNTGNTYKRLILEEIQSIIDKELYANPKLNGNNKEQTAIYKMELYKDLFMLGIMSQNNKLIMDAGPKYYQLRDFLGYESIESMV